MILLVQQVRICSLVALRRNFVEDNLQVLTELFFGLRDEMLQLLIYVLLLCQRFVDSEQIRVFAFTEHDNRILQNRVP